MRTRELQRCKERLLELQQRLREDVQSRLERVPQLIRSPGEVSDVPTHTADHDAEGIDSEVAVGDIQIKELNEVNAALARIEHGSYGRCVECGTRIDPSRLKAVPFTAYCVECKNRSEAEQAASEPE